MFELFFSFNWLNALLVVFTCFLVSNDRAFSKRVRVEFHLALLLCLLISLLGQFVSIFYYGLDSSLGQIYSVLQDCLRPVIMYLLCMSSESIRNKYIQVALLLPAILNIIFVAFGYGRLSMIVFCIYVIVVLAGILLKSKKGDRADFVFAVSFLLMIFTPVVTEVVFQKGNLLNFSISIIICVFYFYRVMRTYKKDQLTGLLIRHNLNYEMADLLGKQYDIVLIDVDNFKLINDKYGHDRGDEVLVTIVNVVQSHLLKGCRMYRFGGDEFVIISTKVSTEALRTTLETVNDELVLQDLHISFGIVTHKPGEDSALSLTEADKVMYENKRTLKSEGIWDDMTGLYNYRGFLDEMENAEKAVKKENHIMCLVAVDIEHLNNINRAYGYTEGTLVIETLARVLKTCLRGSDFIGHLGSDEFVISVECEGPDDSYINTFISLMKDNMDSAYELSDKEYTIKLNVAKYIIEADTDLTLEDCINNVLYLKQAEKENRRKTDVGEDEQDYNNQDEQVVLDILDNNKLRYAFQPIVSAKDGSIVAYETLMRSNTDIMVSPLKILKYAERNKRVYDVERYTFFNVLGLVSAMKNFPEDRKIFLNAIPGYSLIDSDYDELRRKYSDLLPRLVVEITEQREIDDDALATINLRRGRDGFNLAIDDYGSGCSNTNSLLRYNPHVVKLDRLLITGIDRNAKKQFFVNSIITFARDNSMLILAEGVETESELKTVIRLGVDLIQGYYTARPSFEILDEISADIKKVIVDENLRAGSNQRKVYTASSDGELSVVHLAMEDYTKINVSAEKIKITGSTEYTADMVIRIKEGVTCNMTLADVRLNSIDDEPCIEVGEGAHLILRLEGQSRFNGLGIHVPDGSSLVVKGNGNIEIYAKGHKCYCIGADYESGFGKLLFKNSGSILLNADGESCVCVGGGKAGKDSGIEIAAGRFDINVASVDAIGIGYFEGEAPIIIKDCEVNSDFRVNIGTVIGTAYGKLDVDIRNFNIDILGSGTKICGIGSVYESEGKIDIHSGTYKVKINGQKVLLVGTESGLVNISVAHSRLDMIGEGDNAMGFGSLDMVSKVSIVECSLGLTINASAPTAFGTSQTDVQIDGPTTIIKVNGKPFTLSDTGA